MREEKRKNSNTCAIACKYVKQKTDQHEEPPEMAYQTAHEVQCWPECFRATIDGRKMFEYLPNDRDYKVGDFLILQEWDKNRGYTGCEKQTQITYVLAGPEMDVPEGRVILGIKSLN